MSIDRLTSSQTALMRIGEEAAGAEVRGRFERRARKAGAIAAKVAMSPMKQKAMSALMDLAMLLLPTSW
jgi:hypothetical protein